MIWPFPISQHSLHDRGFHIGGLRLAASVFPFFDDRGAVRLHMITTSTDGRILLLPHASDLWQLALRKRAPEVAWAELEEAQSTELDRFRDLWHFDPWWELGEPRYAANEAVPAIKATNVPGYDDRITGLWFSRDLGRVSLLRFGTGEHATVRRPRRADYDRLRALRAERHARSTGPLRGARARARTSWRLRPFWS